MVPTILPKNEQPDPKPPTYPLNHSTTPLPTELQTWYTPPPPGVQAKMRVGVAALRAWASTHAWITDYLCAQRGQAEHAVAAYGLFLLLLPTNVQKWFLTRGWHCAPLPMLLKDCGPYLDEARLAGRADGSELGIEVAQYLPKFKNLLGRDLGEADWVGEAAAAHPSYSLRTLHGSRVKYLRAIYSELRRLAIATVWNLPEHIVNGSFQGWWEQRAVQMPSGSSSLRHNLDPYKVLDTRLKSGDRPGKRAAWEALDPIDFVLSTAHYPIDVARASTKPEPGLKRRALYAQRDETAFICAYASAGVEKAMNHSGMCPSQRPRDVAEWLSADIGQTTEPSALWLSLDYHNFNKEHSNSELALVDLAFAEAYSLRAQAQGGMLLDKALCSFYLSRLRHQGFISGDAAIAGRSWSGLWSGHRNTARDNTMLHAAYHSLVLNRMRVRGVPCPRRVFFCGDDEDGLHSNIQALSIYYMLHATLGWHFNPVKQMVGKNRHEFLQWGSSVHRLEKPLAAAVATMAMGNWYKQVTLDYNSIASAAADQTMLLVRRGADPAATCDVMGHVLHRTYSRRVRLSKTPLAFIIPAGGGKTTSAAHFGWTDIDDLPTAEQMATITNAIKIEDWAQVNRQWQEVIAGAADVHLPLFAHSTAQLPTGWKHYTLVPSKELHEKNIVGRSDHHQYLSRLNLKHTCESPHMLYSSHAERDKQISEISEPYLTEERRIYYDWRAALGPDHPYVHGLQRVELPKRQIKPAAQFPALATEDYVRGQLHWRPNTAQKQRLFSTLQEDAYKGFYRTWLNQQQKTALLKLPIIHERVPIETKPLHFPPTLQRRVLMAAGPTHAVPLKKEQKMAAVGIHSAIVRYPWEGYHLAQPGQQRHYPLVDDPEPEVARVVAHLF
jgi:hypothetical protein